MRSSIGMLMAVFVATGAVAQPKPPPAGKTEIRWWGHAAFVVRTPAGTTLAIDPWFQNPLAPKDAAWPDKVDAILVTHGHSDHLGNAVELAKKTGAPVLGSFELSQLLGLENTNGGNAGGSVRLKDVTIHWVEAVHSSSFGQDAKTSRYAGAPLGYVIQIDNGPTLYHAGDTALFSSMALIGERMRPSVAMLPIGGHFTMDAEAAAHAARLVKAKTVIPMHFGTFPVLAGKPEQLRGALKGAAKVLELKPGEAVSL
ncbi:MAG: metal-dependent hydrolase [Myxococcaceae bacterium]